MEGKKEKKNLIRSIKQCCYTVWELRHAYTVVGSGCGVVVKNKNPIFLGYVVFCFAQLAVTNSTSSSLSSTSASSHHLLGWISIPERERDCCHDLQQMRQQAQVCVTHTIKSQSAYMKNAFFSRTGNAPVLST